MIYWVKNRWGIEPNGDVGSMTTDKGSRLIDQVGIKGEEKIRRRLGT